MYGKLATWDESCWTYVLYSFVHRKTEMEGDKTVEQKHNCSGRISQKSTRFFRSNYFASLLIDTTSSPCSLQVKNSRCRWQCYSVSTPRSSTEKSKQNRIQFGLTWSNTFSSGRISRTNTTYLAASGFHRHFAWKTNVHLHLQDILLSGFYHASCKKASFTQPSCWMYYVQTTIAIITISGLFSASADSTSLRLHLKAYHC